MNSEQSKKTCREIKAVSVFDGADDPASSIPSAQEQAAKLRISQARAKSCALRSAQELLIMSACLLNLSFSLSPYILDNMLTVATMIVMTDMVTLWNSIFYLLLMFSVIAQRSADYAAWESFEQVYPNNEERQ